MITQFKEVGSRKLLKELYLTGHIPMVKDQVKINGRYYIITAIVLDTDNSKYIIWLRKFK